MSFWNPTQQNTPEPKKSFWSDTPTQPVNNFKPVVPFDATNLGIVKNTILGLPKATLGVAKDIGQGIARSVGTVGITAGNIPTKIANETFLRKNPQPLPFDSTIPTDQSAVGRFMFGGQPIRDLNASAKSAGDTVNELTKAVTGKDTPAVGKYSGLPLAVGGILMDLSGFGGGKSVKLAAGEVPELFLKRLAREGDQTVIENTLKKVGLDDVNSKALSEQLAPTKSVDEVKNVLLKYGQGEPVAPKQSFFEKPTTTETPKPVDNFQKIIDDGFASKERELANRGAIAPLEPKPFVLPSTPIQPSSVLPDLPAGAKVPELPQPKSIPPKLAELSSKKDYYNEAVTQLEDMLNFHPGKTLQRFASKKEGQFLDFKNPDLAKTSKEAQRINERNRKTMRASENVLDGTQFSDQFDNPDVIREQIDQYNTLKENLQSLKDQRKGVVQEIRAEKLDNAIQKSSPAHLKFDQNGYPLSYTSKEKAIVAQSNQLRPTPIDTTTGEGRSIEIQARQARDMLASEGPVKSDVSLPKIIEKTITPVKAKVHLIDTFLTTPKFVMEKIDLGKEAQMLREATNEYWKHLPKNLEIISSWIKRVPGKEANKNIFRWLDGEAIDLPAEQLAVAKEVRTWLQGWAKKLGLPEDRQISHYITHIFDKDVVPGEFDEELAKIITDRVPGQVYDPFLEKRLGVKGYKQDTWAALDAYVKRGTRKEFMDPALEQIKEKVGSTLATSKIEKSQFNYVQKYMDNINMRPTNFDEGFDNLLKTMLGNKLGARPSLVVLGKLRNATFRAMLGLNPASALRNLSQGINTYAVLGEKNTFMGYMGLFKKGAAAELEREGVLNSGFVQDRTLSSFKKTVETTDKVLFAFFDKAEKINRGSAYFGAKNKALNEGKSMDEAIAYGKEVVRQTQFLFDTVDTPVGMSSNIAKTLTQFQSFTTKQIEFLVHLAKDKQYAGLIRYAIGGLAFVYTVGKAFGMKPEELIPSFRFDTPPSLKLPVEIGKAVVNAPDKYNQPRSLSQKGIDIGKTLLGLIPAGSQMKKTYEGINAIQDNGSFDKAGRLQYTIDGSLTSKIQAIAFGKYASQNAQDYFNKAESTAKEEAKLQPIYDKVKALDAEDKGDEAQAIVDDLSDADYEIYKSVRTKALTADTLQGKKDILPTYLQVKSLDKQGKGDEAQAIVDNLTDDQYKYYDLVKKQVEKDQKAQAGVAPDYVEGEPQTNKGVISTIATYAKAIGVDPTTAFNRIFTGQYIRYVANGTIVVERMSLSKSQAIKEEREGKVTTMKLDHTVPLQLGGSNTEGNLQLVPTEVWSSFTHVENALGKALRNGKINKSTAQDLIKNFKEGNITSDYVLSQIK